MGIAEIKNGKIIFRLPCLFRKKLKLPILETTKLRASDSIGTTILLIPTITIIAVYEDPPPNPTDEYTNAITKNITGNKYSKLVIISIL
jgi:hypothetical protein